ncbi:PREDICTED: eukaryotic translation initiation factor 1-like [Elephantulus edwardii]|uniref:eukaryotic translation initiation factor 1-like n=1 Tax=Elephantulus edwardii TaxID=28737 RepID=UPI0003F0C4D3|nr:PREDICTED: eukaryotic translation initiation factor 1-like [Elephantulus edwardii]
MDQPNISVPHKYCISATQNLHSFHPFVDASKGDDLLPAGTDDYIYIRIQQRNGRKTLTTVQRIADDYDKEKRVKAFKKKFACNGTVIEHPEYREVIQLQGYQCKNICQFIVEIGLAKDDQLKVHGFPPQTKTAPKAPALTPGRSSPVPGPASRPPALPRPGGSSGGQVTVATEFQTDKISAQGSSTPHSAIVPFILILI